MNSLREVGSYAGLAAFLGLGVLALLLFSQARELRRLRDWAGAAPERDSELVEASAEVAAERSEEMRRIEAERRRSEELRQAELHAAGLRQTRRQRREAGMPEQTLSERLRERVGGGPGRGSTILRYVLAALLVAALAGAVAFGALHFLGNDGGSGSGGGKSKAGAVDPSRVEVAVLNGTATAGLASQFSDRVEKQGFQIGAVTNSQSSFDQSVVMFKPGFKPEASEVAKGLKISRVRPITGDIASSASTAKVAVVIGESDASGPAA